ncbi:hypothetical protein ACFX12_034629 [Malus domestica]
MQIHHLFKIIGAVGPMDSTLPGVRKNQRGTPVGWRQRHLVLQVWWHEIRMEGSWQLANTTSRLHVRQWLRHWLLYMDVSWVSP